MQTRTPSFRSVSFIAKRVCALLCTAILMPALTACSMPRIAGRAEAEQRQSPCEKAYFDATADNKIAHNQHQHIIRRYFSAQQAVSAWTNTAAQCPARFAEGALRSAQARHMARALGDQLSVAVAPITLSRFDDVESLDVDSKSLATAAQAEDRAVEQEPDAHDAECWRPATAAMRRWISAIVIRPHRNGSHPSRAPLTIVGKRTRPPPCSPTPTRCSIPPPALRHRPTPPSK